MYYMSTRRSAFSTEQYGKYPENGCTVFVCGDKYITSPHITFVCLFNSLYYYFVYLNT